LNEGSELAFTRVELVVCLGTVCLLLLTLLGCKRGINDKANIAVCSKNLAFMGEAFRSYALDHEDALPPARIHYSDQKQVTWDTLIKPYLDRGLTVSNSALAARERDRKLQKIFLCPSDTVPRNQAAKARSYAMSQHSMKAKDWPPGPKNLSGVGLWWTFGPKGDKPPTNTIYNFADTNAQAWIKVSSLPAPKDTMLLTELIATNNNLGKTMKATVRFTGEQLDTNHISPELFHEGKFNYLMVDGHVETLTPRESVGALGEVGTNAAKHFGIWTIRAGD
jgi:prepilin-type processing-associated H-X9-DG protein